MIGHHVVRDPAFDAHHLQRLPVGQTIDVDRVGRVGGEPGKHVGSPVDRVLPHPRPGRVGPGAAEAGPEMERALTARLDPPVGRLEQHGEVADHPFRSLDEEGAQPVELLGDLFGLVEHERGVEARRVAAGPRSLRPA